MGSYDATCSLSDLSIGYGSKAYFVILVPNRYFFHSERAVSQKKININISPRSSYTYYDDLYVPFTLPIKGSYDTYGSLEDIKEDYHTRYLEKYFDESIENIVKAITRNNYEKITNSHHALFKKYTNPKIINKLNSFQSELSLTDLKTLGFIKLKNGRYYRKEFNFEIKLDKTEGKHYSLYRENKEFFSSRSKNLKDFFDDLAKETSVFLSVKKEYRKKISTLSSLSGMMILSEVYEKFSNRSREYNLYEKINQSFLINSGFLIEEDGDRKEYYCPDNKEFKISHSYQDTYYISSEKDGYLYERVSNVKKLSEKWEELTGQEFDVSAYKTKETAFFKKFTKFASDYRKAKKEYDKLNKLKKDIPFPLISLITRFMEESVKNDLLPKFRDNYAFISFLKPILEKGKMLKELEDFQEVCYVFSKNNKMLIQKHSGHQHGNYKESQAFYQDIQDIIAEKIKQEYEDR